MYLEKGKKIPKVNKFEKYKEINEKVYNEDKETLKKYKDYIFDCGTNFTWQSLFTQIAYWRKANAIHKWFVDNVQNGEDNCDYYLVSKEQIEELRDLCQEVLDKIIVKDDKIVNGQSLVNGEWQNNYEDGKVIVNPEVAAALLPTEDGFFFGSTDYDEYYIQDLKYTIEQFDKILKEVDFENEYIVYISSW